MKKIDKVKLYTWLIYLGFTAFAIALYFLTQWTNGCDCTYLN